MKQKALCHAQTRDLTCILAKILVKLFDDKHENKYMLMRVYEARK